MSRSRFEITCWLVLLFTLLFSAVLLIRQNRLPEGQKGATLAKTVERETALKARLELVERLYSPVQILFREGKYQQALLQLDTLIRNYPGEPHGHILQGEILMAMGAPDEAASSFVEGIKLNGDYLDEKNPLSRRSSVQRLVNELQKSLTIRRASAGSGGSALAASQGKINYLKSRLAGGCE